MPTTLTNIKLNLEVHIFHCSRGGRLVALVVVCIVWNLEPLASGGQSSHKLIPHIICQFLYARGKLWTRTYSTRDQVPVCPVFTRAKIKSRFGILKNLPSHQNTTFWMLDACFAKICRINWFQLAFQSIQIQYVFFFLYISKVENSSVEIFFS